jgi:hypothetical protein
VLICSTEPECKVYFYSNLLIEAFTLGRNVFAIFGVIFSLFLLLEWQRADQLEKARNLAFERGTVGRVVNADELQRGARRSIMDARAARRDSRP